MKDQIMLLAAAVDKALSVIEDMTNTVAEVLLDGSAEDLVASGSRFISSETITPHVENAKDIAFKSANHSILKCHARAVPLADFLSTFNYKESERTETFTGNSLRHLRTLVTNVTLELSKASGLINDYKELVDPSDVQNAQSLLQSMVNSTNIIITAINSAITRHNDFFNYDVSFHVDKVPSLSFA